MMGILFCILFLYFKSSFFIKNGNIRAEYDKNALKKFLKKINL